MFQRTNRRLLLAAAAATWALVQTACASWASTPAPLFELFPTPTPTVVPSSTAHSDGPPTWTNAPPLIVSIEISDVEITPSGFSAPAGRPLMLILRNRGIAKHGYRIDGLATKDWIWFETVENPDEAMSGTQLAISDEHAEHHVGGELVPRWLAGVDTVIRPGETKTVMFIPVEAGTYPVTDPTTPGLSATLYVF